MASMLSDAELAAVTTFVLVSCTPDRTTAVSFSDALAFSSVEATVGSTASA